MLLTKLLKPCRDWEIWRQQASLIVGNGLLMLVDLSGKKFDFILKKS